MNYQFLINSFFIIINKFISLFRTTLLAAIVGDTIISDAYCLANNLLANFRNIFVDGSFIGIFTSYFFKHKKDGTEEGFSKFVLFKFTKILSIFSGILMAIFFLIEYLTKTDFLSEFLYLIPILSQKSFFNFIIYMSPLIVLMFLISFGTAYLNCLRKFHITSSAPVLGNICFIVSIYLIKFSPQNVVLLLIVGNLLYAFIQIVYMSLFMNNIMEQKPVKDINIRDNTLKNAGFQLAIPLSELIVNFIASKLVTGTVTYIANGHKIIQFVFSVFGVSLSNVMGPNLSNTFHTKDIETFQNKAEYVWISSAIFALLPALIIYFCGQTIVVAIFHNTAITNTVMFGEIVSILGISLFFYVCLRMANTIAIASDNLRIINYGSIVYAASNVLLAFLMRGSGVLLAWASVIAVFMQLLFILYRLVSKKILIIKFWSVIKLLLAIIISFIFAKYGINYLIDKIYTFILKYQNMFIFKYKFVQNYSRMFVVLISSAIFFLLYCIIFWKNAKVVISSENKIEKTLVEKCENC